MPRGKFARVARRARPAPGQAAGVAKLTRVAELDPDVMYRTLTQRLALRIPDLDSWRRLMQG